jgi:hypothetical protein
VKVTKKKRKANFLKQSSANFFLKGQIINILWLWAAVVKAAIDMYTTGMDMFQ